MAAAMPIPIVSMAGLSAPLADCHALQPGDCVIMRKLEKVRRSGN